MYTAYVVKRNARLQLELVSCLNNEGIQAVSAVHILVFKTWRESLLAHAACFTALLFVYLFIF